MLIDYSVFDPPTKAKRFWLSDYIEQKRRKDGKNNSASRTGMARRMPRVNRSHQKQLNDTLKLLNKQGQREPIIINFENRKKHNSKETPIYCNTSRNQNHHSSLSPNKPIQQKQKPFIKQLSIDLFQRLNTQSLRHSYSLTPKSQKHNHRLTKFQQRKAFQIKASNEWLHAQKQVLKINLKQELIRLQRRKIKKIRLGRDNRTIQQLISELKN